MTILFRFRPLEVFILLLFPLGFFAKYEHLTVGSLILFVSGPAIILYYQIVFLKNKKAAQPKGMAFIDMGVVAGCWFTFMALYLLYLPSAIMMLAIAVVLSLISIYQTSRTKELIIIPAVSFVSAAVLGLVLYSLPFYKVYGFMNLHDTNAQTYADHMWDTYSWHLYQAEEYDQALEANQKAHTAAIRSRDIDMLRDSANTFLQLDSNRQMIINRTWHTYTPLQ